MGGGETNKPELQPSPRAVTSPSIRHWPQQEGELRRQQGELEEERQEVQRKKEEYQRDLERLRDAQRRLERDKDAVQRQLDKMEEARVAEVRTSRWPAALQGADTISARDAPRLIPAPGVEYSICTCIYVLLPTTRTPLV